MRKILLMSACVASSAAAQENRDLCPDRPALSSTPCTVPAGRVVYEASIAGWTLDRTATTRTDTVLVADSALRIGVAHATEIQVGWTAFGHVRERDRASGAIDNASGVGDVALAVRQNVLHPDGSGTSIAVLPNVTLPTGGRALGAGDWSAGVALAVSFDLGSDVSLALTPSIDAAVDEDRDGRHLAYGSVIGVSVPLGKSFSAMVEAQVQRDRDPAGHSTQALGALALAWQPDDDLQLDVGTNIGLNRASPDVELYVGIARRF